MSIDGMDTLLGLPVDLALEALRARGVVQISVTELSARRGATGAGSLRAIRISDGGRSVLAARFPDEVEMDD